MENVLAIAKTLNDLHMNAYGKRMDQMRMHKLLYYVQKESLIETDKPLFAEEFEGWRHGPVLPCVRSEYFQEIPFAGVEDTLSEEAKALATKIFEKYKALTTWQLSTMSHEEFSWQFARKGLNPEDNGNVKLDLDALRLDAFHEKMNRL